VDLKTMSTVAHVRVGEEPNGISFSSLAPTSPPAKRVALKLPQASDMEGMGH
jgi:hypothetical protein